MASTCVSAAQAALQVVHYTGTSWMCCSEGASPLCIQSTVLGRCESPYNGFSQCVHIDQTTACGIDDSPPCGAYTGPHGVYGVQFYHDNHLASLNLTNVQEVVLSNWPTLGYDNSIALCCGAVCRSELVQYNDIDVCNNGEYMLKCAGDDLHGICSIWNNTETGEYLLVNADPGASFQADTPPPTFPVPTPEFPVPTPEFSRAPGIGAFIAVMVILVFIFWRRWRGLKGRSVSVTCVSTLQFLMERIAATPARWILTPARWIWNLQTPGGGWRHVPDKHASRSLILFVVLITCPVQRKFLDAWTPPGRNPPLCPAIMRIFSITHSPASAARFQNYWYVSFLLDDKTLSLLPVKPLVVLSLRLGTAQIVNVMSGIMALRISAAAHRVDYAVSSTAPLT
jgi:hypothetical protein